MSLKKSNLLLMFPRNQLRSKTQLRRREEIGKRTITARHRRWHVVKSSTSLVFPNSMCASGLNRKSRWSSYEEVLSKTQDLLHQKAQTSTGTFSSTSLSILKTGRTITTSGFSKTDNTSKCSVKIRGTKLLTTSLELWFVQKRVIY